MSECKPLDQGTDGGSSKPASAAAAAASVSAISRLVLGGIKGSALASHVGSMVVYSLPSAARASFPAVLSELESRASEYGVGSCGVSCSTLEEVFLNVAELLSSQPAAAAAAAVGAGAAGAGAGTTPGDSAINIGEITLMPSTVAANAQPTYADHDADPVATDYPTPRLQGWALWAQQYRAMLWKRVIHAKVGRCRLTLSIAAETAWSQALETIM